MLSSYKIQKWLKKEREKSLRRLVFAVQLESGGTEGIWKVLQGFPNKDSLCSIEIKLLLPHRGLGSSILNQLHYSDQPQYICVCACVFVYIHACI